MSECERIECLEHAQGGAVRGVNGGLCRRTKGHDEVEAASPHIFPLVKCEKGSSLGKGCPNQSWMGLPMTRASGDRRD